ncbi:hypothetical protein ACSLPB_29805, partial [Escherichia coli]
MTNAINSFDIQFAENMLKAQSRTYRYKKHQLRKIDMRPARILPSIERYEYDVVMREFKGIACVSGKA